MLGIILMILKWIGIILLCILGLILVIILSIFLVPIRYRLNLSFADKKVNGVVNVHWLLHLLSVYVNVRDNKARIYAKILGFRVFDMGKEKVENVAEETKQAVKNEAETLKETVNEQVIEAAEPVIEAKEEIEQAAQENSFEEVEESECEPNEMHKESVFQEESEKTKEVEDEIILQESEADLNSSREDDLEENDSKDDGLEEKNSEELESEVEKQSLLETISSFYHNICDKIQSIIAILLDKKKTLEQKIEYVKQKIDSVQHIWADSRVQHAVQVLKKQLVQFLRHLKPKKVKFHLHLGIPDVALLGQICGITAIFFPTFGESIIFEPDFEKEILEMDLFLKGRFQIGSIIKLAFALLISKDVRYTIGKIKAII